MRNDGAELTMSGRAATNPIISGGKGERVSFRAVSTERRFDEASGDWIDGDEFGVSVVCWRQLASSVLQLLRKGDPVVVVGKISTRRYERDGVIDYFTEVKADHIAFDAARSVGRLKREDPGVIETLQAKAAEDPVETESVEPEEPVEAAASADMGDPFQSSAGSDPARPLVAVG